MSEGFRPEGPLSVTAMLPPEAPRSPGGASDEKVPREDVGGNAGDNDAAPGGEELAAQEPPTEVVRERSFQRAPGTGRKRGQRLVRPEDVQREPFTAEQRLLVLDSWQRSGLPAGDFAPLVGISRHTLYAWKKKFDQLGPAGLLDQPRGTPEGSRLPELLPV